MKQKDVRLEDYGISPTLAFLSPDPPATRLSSPYYEAWEKVNDRLSDYIKSGELVDQIQNLPLLNTDQLVSQTEWRRAYVVVSFMIHAWIWHSDIPKALIPPALSEPYLEVCKHIGQEPVLSYSGLCLWNWKTKDGSHGPASMKLANLECLASFTGSHDEATFYLVPDVAEAAGGALPGLLLHAIDASQQGEADFVAMTLVQCAEIFTNMASALGEFTNGTCKPNYFYTTIRPFLAGSAGMESKGLPNGIQYQRANGEVLSVKTAGGSAVQSALFPAIDQMLGIEHASPVFKDSRAYMPGEHRRFLQTISELPNLRDFVVAHPENQELQQAYDKCMETMRVWRSKHINLVTRYIVLPGKQAAKMASSDGSAEKKIDADVGTAGSAPVPFLKVARDETLLIGGQS